MFIVYTSPVDGLPRARRVNNYREAGQVMAMLEEMGVNPDFNTRDELINAHTTCLPLIVNTENQACITHQRLHQPLDIVI